MGKIETVSELLTEQMNHWLLFPPVLTFLGIIRAVIGTGEPGLLLWALCGLIPPLFFLFRRKIGNLILFLLAHLGVLAAVFALSGQSVPVRIVCVVCAAGYLLQSLTLRLKQGTVYSGGLLPAFGVGLSALSALLQHYRGTPGWEVYYHFAMIAVIALYFVNYYLEHYLDFLAMNQSSAGFLPAAEMFRSGMGLALGYTMLGVAALILSTQFAWLAGLLRPAGKLLLRLLRFLFSRTPSPEEAEYVEESMPQNDMGSPIGLPEGGETFWLWRVLEVLMMVVFWAAAVVGLCLLLWKLLQLIRKHMQFRFRETELQTGEAFDFREKCEIEKGIRKSPQDLFRSLSPRERIRRLYHKKLPAMAARMGAEENPGFHTAREWEGRLSLEGMAELYEQARYSQRELTGADVKRMKDVWR